MAEIDPPYMAPMYREANIPIPDAGGNPNVNGNNRAMAIVADKPGIAPTNIPMKEPTITSSKLNGCRMLLNPNRILLIIIFYPRNPIGTGRFKNLTNNAYTNRVNPKVTIILVLNFIDFNVKKVINK